MTDQYGRADDAPDPNDPLLLAARANDSEIEELGEGREAFEAYCKRHDLVLSTIEYLAEQRAMRYALTVTGDRDKLTEAHKTNAATAVLATPEQVAIMEFAKPIYIDSILIGWRARKLSE